jgi:hypothetical protein
MKFMVQKVSRGSCNLHFLCPTSPQTTFQNLSHKTLSILTQNNVSHHVSYNKYKMQYLKLTTQQNKFCQKISHV